MTSWRNDYQDTLVSLIVAIKDASWTWRPDAVGELRQRGRTPFSAVVI